jgi:hypothetical protein
LVEFCARNPEGSASISIIATGRTARCSAVVISDCSSVGIAGVWRQR